MKTSCTLYFDSRILTSLMPNVFVAVVDNPNSNGFYTVSIWVGRSTDLVWSPNGFAEHISSETEPQASFRTRLLIDDIEVRKSSRDFYVELASIGLYEQMNWEVIKVDNATIFKPKFVE